MGMTAIQELDGILRLQGRQGDVLNMALFFRAGSGFLGVFMHTPHTAIGKLATYRASSNIVAYICRIAAH